MSRESFFGSLKENWDDTSLTAWYGLIGASASVGAPLIGIMNPPLAIISAAVPLFARWHQINEISRNNPNMTDNEIYAFKARAVVKALVNIGILAATYTVGMTVGQTACFVFLVAFCVSKLINLGNASPIQHIENWISGQHPDAYPENRQGVFSSLAANITETLRASFYGIVAAATLFPLPLIGLLTPVTAALLFMAPYTARVSQISQMQPDLNPDRPNNHQAKALVSTATDVLVGLGLFATATILQLDKVALLAVIAGWAAAKLTSGGENSPIHHTQRFFSSLGASTQAPEEHNIPVNGLN
ncbi:MAG: hypothetical protein P1U39_04290 [Legionellaceae bacterium]|nr:hypothetical protein [Legionellaceae bacterium]